MRLSNIKSVLPIQLQVHLFIMLVAVLVGMKIIVLQAALEEMVVVVMLLFTLQLLVLLELQTQVVEVVEAMEQIQFFQQ